MTTNTCNILPKLLKPSLDGVYVLIFTDLMMLLERMFWNKYIKRSLFPVDFVREDVVEVISSYEAVVIQIGLCEHVLDLFFS